MQVKERTVSIEAERVYEIDEVIILSQGDILKIESNGVEHLILPVPTGKKHQARFLIHIHESPE